LSETNNFVTVADVLAKLYGLLRLVISQNELNFQSQESQRDISAAFYQRVNRDPWTAAVEKKKGLKRIDFLKGHTRFMGLTSTKVGPDVWVLNVR